MKSLDDILGSRDEQEATSTEGQQQQVVFKRVPGWAWAELQEPRVVPLATNALYYTLLVVFVSYYVVQLSDGQEAADDLIARLANDHAAVASGDALRLYTAPFVADSVSALIFGLVGMATVASELESLLGYSTFWALLSLGILTGSLSDAALSSVPITQGPGPAVAAVAAALLAYHARNWQLEQQLLQVKSGKLPKEFMQLEADFNSAHAAAQQGSSSDTTHTSETTAAAASEASSPAERTQQQQVQQGMPAAAAAGAAGRASASSMDGDDGPDLVETDLDLPLLSWLGVTVLLPQEGKAFVTLGGIACSVLSTLRDVTSTDIAADWPGLMGSFAAGLWLGWNVSPIYQVQLVLADTSSSSSSSSHSTADAPAATGSAATQQQQQQQQVLLPVLRDTRPAVARANVVLGYAGVLFALLGGWLLQQGG